jgi:hypothetical protein
MLAAVKRDEDQPEVSLRPQTLSEFIGRPLDVSRRLGGKRQGRKQKQQDEGEAPLEERQMPGHSPPPRFAWKRQVGRAPLGGPISL